MQICTRINAVSVMRRIYNYRWSRIDFKTIHTDNEISLNGFNDNMKNSSQMKNSFSLV